MRAEAILARLPIWCMSALAIAGCAGAMREDRLTADRLIAHFEAVVLSDQYEPTRDLGRVRKWTGPIRIALRGGEVPRFRAIVRGYAAELAALTRLRIEVLEQPEAGANFEIRFASWDDMEKEARAFAPQPDWLGTIVDGAACLFIYRRNDRFEVVRALVLVSTREADDHKARCLLEEMTQALGLPSDSDVVQPSIFNAFDRLSALSPADRILVRTLYDPRILPGMPRADALAAARAIIGEMRAGAR